MMRNIKDIFSASVCSFYENIYMYYSLDVESFLEFLNSYLIEFDLNSCLKSSDVNLIYDIEEINNVCDNADFKHKTFEYNQIIDGCRSAYVYTLESDKTIDVEAFVDNLAKKFAKM